MPLVPAKKQKTPACIREIQVHKLWTKVYSQQGLTAMYIYLYDIICSYLLFACLNDQCVCTRVRVCVHVCVCVCVCVCVWLKKQLAWLIWQCHHLQFLLRHLEWFTCLLLKTQAVTKLALWKVSFKVINARNTKICVVETCVFVCTWFVKMILILFIYRLFSAVMYLVLLFCCVRFNLCLFLCFSDSAATKLGFCKFAAIISSQTLFTH